jgi:hypothetical protein
MLKNWLARLAIGLLCLQVAAAAPESAAPSASDSAWSIERLDSLFAAHDWTSLASALSNAKTADQFAQQMDWMRDNLMAGAGSLLGFLYSRDLWSAGREAKSSDPMNDLRVTAALFTLYTLELITIDGERCEDRSAPSHRLDQLLENNRPILLFLKAQPAKVKSKVIDLALAIERQTAPLRTDDEVLCRAGLDEIQAGLDAGEVKEVKPHEGEGGKAYEVTAPPTYKPKFLPPNVYEPAQRKAREEMRSYLRKLLS